MLVFVHLDTLKLERFSDQLIAPGAGSFLLQFPVDIDVPGTDFRTLAAVRARSAESAL